MSKRFGRNQRRRLREVERELVRMEREANFFASRCRRMEKEINPIVTCAVLPMWEAAAPHVKVIEATVTPPKIAMRSQVDTQLVDMRDMYDHACDKMKHDIMEHLNKCLGECFEELLRGRQ